MVWSRVRLLALLAWIFSVSSPPEVRGGELQEEEQLYPTAVHQLSRDLADIDAHFRSPLRSPPTGFEDGMTRMGEVASDEKVLPAVKPSTGNSIKNVIDSVQTLAPEPDLSNVNRSYEASQIPSPKIADSLPSLGSSANRVGKAQDSFDAITKKSALDSTGPADPLETIEEEMLKLVAINPEDLKFEDYETLKRLLGDSLDEVKLLLPKVPGFADRAERLMRRWAAKDASGEAGATQLRVEQVTRLQAAKPGEIHAKPKAADENH